MANSTYALRTTAGWNSMTAGEQAAYDGYFETFDAWKAAEIDTAQSGDTKTLEHFGSDWPAPTGYASPLNLSSVTSGVTVVIRAALGEPRLYMLADSGSNSIAVLQIDHSGDPWVVQDIFAEQSRLTGPAVFFKNPGVLYNVWGKAAQNKVLELPAAIGFSSDSLDTANWPTIAFCLAIDSPVGFSNIWGYDIRTRGFLYNCLAVNCYTGFHSGTTNSARAVNCATLGCTEPYTNETTEHVGAWDEANSSNNASNDYTNQAIAIPGASPYQANVVSTDFVDTGEYHLSLNSPLLGVGANLYTELAALGYTTDPDGDALPDTGAWDLFIGRNEAAVSTPTLSNCEATDVTENSVVGRVTVTYG